MEVHQWLRMYSWREWFGFRDHRLGFLEDGLLAHDGFHLTQMWGNVFGWSLTKCIRKKFKLMLGENGDIC